MNESALCRRCCQPLRERHLSLSDSNCYELRELFSLPLLISGQPSTDSRGKCPKATTGTFHCLFALLDLYITRSDASDNDMSLVTLTAAGWYILFHWVKLGTQDSLKINVSVRDLLYFP